ncbi:hypothetical protein EI94DRAFT_1802862 [Lactarius quietus]|nr:hypothetical protein EI94DRAFT_1802862 [Lactarius quietus]
MGPGQNVPYRPPYGAPPYPPYPPYPPFQRQPFPHPLFPHQEAFQHQAFLHQPFPQEPFPHPPLQHPPTYQSPFQYPPTQCLPVQYGPYPMGALPDPVPHQVTTHQSQQGLPAHDFNATVGTAPPVHAEQKVKGRQTGRAKRGATATLTESDHPMQNYQNPWVRNGVEEGDGAHDSMRERIIASRMHAVAMELKNLHMTANMTKARTKGKEKRT